MNGISALYERPQRVYPSLFCYVRTKEQMLYKTRKWVLIGHHIYLAPLISDFQPPEQQELNACCPLFKLLSLWYYLIVAEWTMTLSERSQGDHPELPRWALNSVTSILTKNRKREDTGEKKFM